MKRVKKWILCLMLTSTSGLMIGCGTNVGVAPAFCSTAGPIFPSRKDVLTDGTKRQIVLHNELGVSLCGWQPPQKSKEH